MNFFSIIQLNNLTQIIRFRNKVQFPGNQFQTISKIAFYKIAVSTEENIFVDKVRHLEKKKNVSIVPNKLSLHAKKRDLHTEYSLYMYVETFITIVPTK